MPTAPGSILDPAYSILLSPHLFPDYPWLKTSARAPGTVSLQKIDAATSGFYPLRVQRAPGPVRHLISPSNVLRSQSFDIKPQSKNTVRC